MSVKCPSCGSKKIKHLNNAPSGIESTTKGYSGYKTGAAVGATVGTAIPVIGTVAGLSLIHI